MSHALTALDRVILFLLQDDARLSASAIAERAEAPVWDVARRMAILEQEGLIAGARAVLDPAKAGFPVVTFFKLRLADDRRETADAFAEAVRLEPQILDCWMIERPGAYLLRVVARDEMDLERLRADVIERMPAVLAVGASAILSTVKSTTKLPV